MNTQQNYGANPAPANPVVPTAQQADSAAQSAPPTAEQYRQAVAGTSSQSSVSLDLDLFGEGDANSEVMLVFCALIDYRQTLQNMVVDYARTNFESDAKTASYEVETIDELLVKLTRKMATASEYNYWLIRHMADPQSYPSYQAWKAGQAKDQ
ncbi:hypothetical protein [Fibrella aestuarina]|nr:hypothetical protein [Fibrella aestuarina]